MIFNVIGCAVALWWVYRVVLWFRAVQKHRRQALTTGWPSFLSPLHANDISYLVLHKIISSITKWLPQDRMRNLYPWTVLVRLWHAGYRPFEEIGSDSFFLTTSSGNMLVTCDPTVARQIFERPSDFKSPVDILSIYNIYGPTLAATEDDDWRRHRKITTPYFNSETNNAVWEETLKQTDSYLANWKINRPDIVDSKSYLTARIIMSMFGKVFFGKEIRWEDYNANDQEITKLDTFGEAIIAVTHNIGIILLMQSLPRWFAKLLPFQITKFADQAYNNWNLQMEEMRSDVLSRLDGNHGKNSRFTTLLESIIHAGEVDGEKGSENQSFTRAEVFGNMFFFTTAGYETSSTTSAFTLLLLSLHTDIQERAQQEVDKIVGHRAATEWTLEDFTTLFDGYLGAIVKETLRLYGPVEWLAKKSIRDVTLTEKSGQTRLVPKDTSIVVDFPAMFRHPQYWPGEIDATPASQFNPEIWMSKKTNPSEQIAYYPFSGGRRACPGRRFAEIQMTALLARIFVEYSVEFVPREEDVKHAKHNGLGQNWVKEKTREVAAAGLYDRIGFSHGIFPKKHLAFRLIERARSK